MIPAPLREERSVSVQERTRSVQERTHDFSELFNRAVAACAESQRIVGLSARTMRFASTSRAAAIRLRRAAVLMRDTWTEADAVHSVLRNEVERVARAMREAGFDDRAAVATVGPTSGSCSTTEGSRSRTPSRSWPARASGSSRSTPRPDRRRFARVERRLVDGVPAISERAQFMHFGAA
jgi:dihydroxyacid dehydratase/phosphogluconate dehydratase